MRLGDFEEEKLGALLLTGRYVFENSTVQPLSADRFDHQATYSNILLTRVPLGGGEAKRPRPPSDVSIVQNE